MFVSVYGHKLRDARLLNKVDIYTRFIDLYTCYSLVQIPKSKFVDRKQ